MARAVAAGHAHDPLALQVVELDVAVVEGQAQVGVGVGAHGAQAVDAAVEREVADGRAHDAQVPEFDGLVVAGGGDLVLVDEDGAVDAAAVAFLNRLEGV